MNWGPIQKTVAFFLGLHLFAFTCLAADFRLNRKSSQAQFSIQSGLFAVQGKLEQFDADLEVLSKKPLRMKVVATADLRSLQLVGSDQLSALSNMGLLQSVPNPQMSLWGELKTRANDSGCVFEGKVQRGKQVRALLLPCVWKKVTSDSIVVSMLITGKLSGLVDDLPIQLPVADGDAKATGLFTFQRSKS